MLSKLPVLKELAAHSRKRILTNREEAVPSLDEDRSWLPWEVEIYIC